MGSSSALRCVTAVVNHNTQSVAQFQGSVRQAMVSQKLYIDQVVATSTEHAMRKLSAILAQSFPTPPGVPDYPRSVTHKSLFAPSSATAAVNFDSFELGSSITHVASKNANSAVRELEAQGIASSASVTDD